MRTFTTSSTFPVSTQTLFDYHKRPGVLQRLTPAWSPVEVLRQGKGIDVGVEVHLKMKIAGVPVELHVEHTQYDEGVLFVDEQRRGPFRSWHHEHKVEPAPGGGSRLIDTIQYELPMGFLGSMGNGKAARDLERLFRFRHARTLNDLVRLERGAHKRPRTIAISGASGLIGRALTSFWKMAGVTVIPLVRRDVRSEEKAISWDPQHGTMDGKKLEGVDVLVHLAGENVGSGRWTPKRKAQILESRRDGTRLLAETLASLKTPPSLFVSASAVGIYGATAEDAVETSSPGDDFLAEVGKAWESGAEPAREAGIPVVHPRLGVVLSASGGALGRMIGPFKAGVGGVVGSGNQWLSWITKEDVVGIFDWLVTHDIEGPVNCVAPAPASNREFTQALGEALGRPTVFPLPGTVVKALFGEKGESLLLAGPKALPKVLVGSNYPFLYPDLLEGIQFSLGD